MKDEGEVTVKRGRPRLQVDLDRVRQLHKDGLSLRQIAKECGVSKTTVLRALQTTPFSRSKNVPKFTSSPGHSAGRVQAIVDPTGSQGPNPVSGPILRAHVRTWGGRAIRIVVGGVHPEDQGLFQALRLGVRWPAEIEVEAGEPANA